MLKEWIEKNKTKRINKIVEDIKSIKIQGARNIALHSLYAYHLLPTRETKSKLLKSRPTEPMLLNTLNKFEILGYGRTLAHFQEAQDRINFFVFHLIKNNSIIFTHCHSTNVITALIFAKKKGRKFQVYNTETRPLFQGRKTSSELSRAGIKVTEFVDSATKTALVQAKNLGEVIVFFGADAILKNGIINKIGSGMFAEIAANLKIPVYIVADSWKFSPQKINLEERNFKEIWEKSSPKIKIENPAFELVPKKYIRAIISELGIFSLDKFIKKV